MIFANKLAVFTSNIMIKFENYERNRKQTTKTKN